MNEAANMRFDEAAPPCPEPLESAVEAQIFGRCADGTPRPSPEEVAAMTAEHARGMLDLLCESAHLKRCLRRGVHPRSGRALRGPRRAERRSAMRRDAASLQLQYLARREAYASAFGWEAAQALDDTLQRLARLAEQEAGPDETQARLF